MRVELAGTASPLPHKNLWQRVLVRRSGQARARRIIAQAQVQFDGLFQARIRYANRALRHHLEQHILPGLALYWALLEDTADREKVVQEWIVLQKAVALERRRLISLLRILPMPFAFTLLRWFTRFSMRFEYPAIGWEIKWVADTPERLAFDIHRCFYLETLNALGAPELTKHFCALDDWLFEVLRPAVLWARTRTLGCGNDRCDFCWIRA